MRGGVVIKGCDPEVERRTDDALRHIVSGSADFAPDADGFDSIVVGKLMAEELNIRTGDYVTLTSPEGRLTPYGMVPRSRRFPRGGSFSIPASTITTPTGRLRRWPRRKNLAGVGDVVSVLEFRVQDVDHAADAARAHFRCRREGARDDHMAGRKSRAVPRAASGKSSSQRYSSA